MARYSLWEQEPNGLYTNIFKIGDSVDQIAVARYLNDTEQCPKNNDLSLECRLKGNAEVEKNNWRNAMSLYNQSLRWAKIGSEHVALAYANRSTCFMKFEMYEKCLIDIELAINAKYPEHLKSKLEARRTFCLNEIKKAKPVEKVALKLDYEEDEHFPGMANVAKMAYNEKFGRHLVAKRDIDVGKVILMEDAFLTIIVDAANNVCGYCLKNTMNFIACKKCSNTMFCSQTCAESDKLHEIICSDAIVYKNSLTTAANRSIFLALNIFPNMDELIGFVENVVSDTKDEALESLDDIRSKYRTFLQLNLWISNDEILELLIWAIPAFTRLMSKPAIKAKIRSLKDRRFLMHLFMMHNMLIKCNSFQHNILGGIFLIPNHINHSCAPNLIAYHHENKMIGIVSRPIKMGDQIFITYGGEKCFLQPKMQRQQYLWNGFGFQCDCEKCSNNNWPVSSTRIRFDPEYKFLLHQMRGGDIDFTDNKKCSSLKQKCLTILKKYSDIPWTTELDIVSNHFTCLLNETAMHL